MNGKYRLSLYILGILLVTFSCKNEDTYKTSAEALVLSQNEFTNVSFEGEQLSISINSNTPWKAYGQAEWCHLSTDEATAGNSKINIHIDPNLEEERACTITIENKERTKKTIQIKQSEIPNGQEYLYKIPIVFQVIYRDKYDKNQNPDGKYLQEIIKEVNEIYRGLNPNSIDMHVEFIPATTTPSGDLLPEAGIHRIHHQTSRLDVYDVMHSQEQKYNHFIWNPNKYINVLLYTFYSPIDLSANQILGVATSPITTSNAPLEGIKTTNALQIDPTQLKYAHCISLNNLYVREQTLLFDNSELDKQQRRLSKTLAHELGHYLGLYHVFSESRKRVCEDTDFCHDTPSYNKTIYSRYLQQLSAKWIARSIPRTEATIRLAFERESCEGVRFEAHNIMDYSYCYQDIFTPEQHKRVRHILMNSPLIPGPKLKITGGNTRMDELYIPHSVACFPSSTNRDN